MKRRDTLLRLKRFRVDDLKRRMATLDGMKADLERKLADLEDSVARERQRANDTDIGRLAFPSFLQSIDTRRENLRATLGELERERGQAQGELTSCLPGSEEPGTGDGAAGQAAPPKSKRAAASRGWTRWRWSAICASTRCGRPDALSLRRSAAAAGWLPTVRF